MMVTWKAGLFQKYGLEIERPRIMGGARGVVRGLMAGEIQFGNLAAPAPLRANLKGEADIVFLTGGINQQFVPGARHPLAHHGREIEPVASPLDRVAGFRSTRTYCRRCSERMKSTPTPIVEPSCRS